MDARAAFAGRLRAGAPLAGIFVKSRDPAVVEILALAGFDFVVIDGEHGVFDRTDIATLCLAARAGGIAALVRVPPEAPDWIGASLDAGAAGIVAPQVADAAAAAAILGRMRYGPGGAGFSPSTAGALYGRRGVAAHLAARAGETVLVCQIEAPEAVAKAPAIAAVEGVDALLVGPVDLAVSAGLTDPGAPEVAVMTRAVLAAAQAAGRAGGLFLGDPAKAADWRAAGATLFVIGSDQAFLAAAARGALAGFGG